ERRRAEGEGARCEGGWHGGLVHGGGARGYSAGSGVLPQRRNSAVRAAAVGGVGVGAGATLKPTAFYLRYGRSATYQDLSGGHFLEGRLGPITRSPGRGIDLSFLRVADHPGRAFWPAHLFASQQGALY